MQKAYDALALVFHNMKFKGFLMDLDGKCIELPVAKDPTIKSQAKEDPFLAFTKTKK
jgi:hypothetical protein